MLTTWEGLLNNEQYNQINAGVAYTNSVTLTDVSPGGNNSGQAFQLVGSALYTGMQIRFRATGVASTSGTPNLTLGIYYGGVAGVALASTTFAASANLSNGTWILEAFTRCDGTGTAGTLRTQGHVVGLGTGIYLPQTTTTGGAVSVNTGTTSLITLGAQWGTASNSNSLTVYQWMIELLN